MAHIGNFDASMHLSKLYPSKYLAAADLDGRAITATVSHVTIEEVGQEKQRKPVLYLKGAPKGIVLNVTNARMLARAYGEDLGKWTGAKVTVKSEPVAFRGEVKDSIRLYPATTAQPAPAPVADPDDDLPWPPESDTEASSDWAV